MKKIFLTLIAALSLIAVQAQQEPQYALYMFSKQAINPGSVGSRGNLSAYTDYRSQWTKVDGAPETFNIGLQIAPNNGAEYGRHAAGLQLYHDRIGVSKSTGLMLQYAYRVPVSRKTILSFGLQGSLINYTNNLYQVRGLDVNDPVQTNGVNSNVGMNMGAGVYAYSERFFAGFSVPQLLQSEKDLRGNETRRNERHYILMAGYLLPVNDELKLRFNAIAKYVPLGELNSPASADFNLSFIFFDRIIAGASYRTDNTLSVLAQMQLTKALNLGYAYDFNTGDYGRPAGGAAHEIFLGFDLNSLKGPFTTPRFVSFF
jgi:type IX secretion system PorP/SprF family membrane protein